MTTDRIGCEADAPAGQRLNGWLLALVPLVGVAGAALAQPPAPAANPADVPPAKLVLEDQFDKPADLAAHRGAVVVLVYGDRRGTDACKELGEKLHLCWHPTAKGLPPAKAKLAPVVGLDGLRPGQTAPDVHVIPVACCGKVPIKVARDLIRSQVAKGSPDVPVWMDFGNVMKDGYGLAAGQPNVALFDAAGRPRAALNGTPDQATLDQLVQAVQGLRMEAVK